MATCVLCGKPISDGLEYCSECNAKNKADESYLDSLLSSVSAPSSESLKNRVHSQRSTANPVMPKFLASKAAKVEAEKFEEAIAKEINNPEEEISSDSNYDILSIADDSYLDNLFAESEVSVFSDAEADEIPETPVQTASEETILPETPDFFSAPEIDDLVKEDAAAFDTTELLQDSDETEAPATEEDFLADLLGSVDSAAAESEMEEPAEDPIAALDEAFAIAEESNETTESEESEPQLTYAEIPDFDDELQSDEDESDKDSETVTAPEAEEQKSKVSVVAEDNVSGDGGDEDILEFWNNINGEEGSGEGKYLLNADNTETPEENAEEASDENDELAALFAGIPIMDEETGNGTDAQVGEIEAPDAKKAKKKKGFFARIFGNVREEYTEEELEEKKQKAIEQYEKDQEAALQSKEAKKARAAELKAAKAEAAKLKKAEAAEAKKKKAEDAKAKKEEKDKKAAERRAIIEEIEANEGRINKVGASLVFVVFAIILCFIAVGTSVYTYRVAISRAERDFERDEYEQAYQDIYGIDVKEEDQQLYDQIMTVNYVNTQLMSYLKYSGLEMENEALDSLLKGLRRYEKYILFAKELGVDSDLDSLKTKILLELDTKYHLSEAQAYAIINSATQELYSQAVRDVVDKIYN